jgi:hypothetical protein
LEWSQPSRTIKRVQYDGTSHLPHIKESTSKRSRQTPEPTGVLTGNQDNQLLQYK